MEVESFYRSLYRIRRVEEELARAYPTDKIKSPVHLSIGQEAVSVAVCEALRKEDVVFGTYRSHALYLAKGGDLNGMIAEMYGKATGCTRGKGGSMHLIDTRAGVMGTSAVVGTTIANAVGYAYATQLQDKNLIVSSFFGDGATEEGVFAESLNFAVLKRLPVLFICENNGYAIHTHQSQRQGHPNISDRAKAAGVATECIEDNDAERLHDRVCDVVDGIRTGRLTGPWFFECKTYRIKEHVGPNEDWKLGYRQQSDAQRWVEGDQVKWFAALVHPTTRQRIEADVESEIRVAFQFAEISPFPSVDQLYSDVFKTREAAGAVRKVA